jgi:photosystem II stability/assembly factor-like uncharacterized protein
MKKLQALIIVMLVCGNIYPQWTAYYTEDLSQHYDMVFVNQNTGFTGGVSTDIYKTTNCGVNWNLISSPFPTNTIYCLFFANAGTGWAGTYTGSILKTINGGYNWSEIPVVYNKQIYDMCFINENTGWYAGENGAYGKTTNGGTTWFTPSSNLFQDGAYAVYFADANTGFVSGINNLARTTDGGLSWNNTAYPNIYLSALYFVNENTGFAMGSITQNDGSALYVLKTTNKGINWNVVCSETPIDFYVIRVKDAYFFNENCGYFAGMSIHTGPSYTFTGILRKTTNGGINWSSVYYSFGNSLEAVTFVNQQTGFAASETHTIYKTTNGGLTGFTNETETMPSQFTLYQNYPNPFNPVTKIKFDVPENGKVVIKVFDVLGKEIATLVNVKLQPGTYETTYDGSNLNSGIYFYQLSINNKQPAIKKMVLLK